MGGVEQDMTCSLEKVDRDNQANKRTRYGTLDAPVVMRARYTGLGENRMADFHWEVQGILRGRDDARLILKKRQSFLPTWQVGKNFGVKKSWGGDRDFDPGLSDG